MKSTNRAELEAELKRMADAWIRQTENDAQWLLKPEARADFARVFLAGAQAGLALGKREGLEKAAEICDYHANLPNRNAACKASCADVKISCLATALRISRGEYENPTSFCGDFDADDWGARKPTATKGEP